jgi:ferric-dicitrate binding protein FerR (iron transport regulator)
VHLYPIDIQKMNTPTDIDILIIRLFSDEANPDEKKKIAEWLNQSSENTKLYTDLREIWLASGIQSNADNYHLEDVIHNFREQIRRRKYQDENQINLRQFLKYAAIFVLILAFSFSYYRVNLNNNSAFSSTTISCDFGDKSNIILPDGSIVWLNSGSKLTFNADFKSEGRNVFLEGEAFFSVSKNKFHPFRVRTADVDIEVLGTKFNVKAYPEEKLVSTTRLKVV